MAETETQTLTAFQTHPSEYQHWKLTLDGSLARLDLDVQEKEGTSGTYALKQNSYDLSVDVELNDALQRIRFEHPEVKVLVLSSSVDRIFCAGANIYMLGSSTHAFKQNFCKYTNETRILIEETSEETGVRSICACNGTAAGGGYELAMACDEIYLVDDGNSAVSLPEVPLLGVLPGTGGLTRLVDKRMVRRDRADVFCTVAEGVKGQRAVKWGLVDGIFSRSSFAEKVDARATELSKNSSRAAWKGITLEPTTPEVTAEGMSFRHVRVSIDPETRVAALVLSGPGAEEPDTPDGMLEQGSDAWALRAFRELDRALLHLRVDYPDIGLVLVRTEGDPAAMLRIDRALEEHATHPFVAEIRFLIARVLRRMDLTAKSFFALIEPGSCFAGTLLELALAADRSYMLEDEEDQNALHVSSANAGAYPMPHGLTRLEDRYRAEEDRVQEILGRCGEPIGAQEADDLGLVTMSLDDLDYEDETRLSIEERVSLSPDALTGMEASLRFPGPESMESKIFGRLSAWQNWIFQRPNAVGPKGALTTYGQPTRPEFDFRRT